MTCFPWHKLLFNTHSATSDTPVYLGRINVRGSSFIWNPADRLYQHFLPAIPIAAVAITVINN